MLEVDLFLSVSWSVVFWEHLLLKKLWCLEPDAGGCWWLPGGAQCSWISFELQLVPQLLLRLLTIFQDLACVPCLADNVPLHRFFYSDLLYPCCVHPEARLVLEDMMDLPMEALGQLSVCQEVEGSRGSLF